MWVVALAVGLLAWAGSAGAAGSGGHARPPLRLAVLTPTRDAALTAGAVRVRASATRALRVRLRGTGLRVRTVRLRRGSQVVALRLTAAGRRALRGCTRVRVTIGAQGARAARTFGARRCSVTGAGRAGGGDPGAGGSAGGTPPSGGQGAQTQLPDALGCDSLDPAVCLYPFPNDYFTRSDPTSATGRRVNLSPLAVPRNVAGKPIDPTDWNRLDGFSPGSPLITKVPGLDNPEAMRRTGAVPITDEARAFDPAAPIVVIDATTHERHPIWSEIDSNASDPADAALIIRPAVNWQEKHRYIVALRDLRDRDGNAIQPGADFKALRDGTPTLNPLLEQRRAHYDDLFATLGAAGIARKGLYLTWDFTVGSADSLAGRMLHIRNDAFAQLGDDNLSDLRVAGHAPAYSISSVADSADGPIARTIKGTVTVPCYLSTPACAPAHSQFVLDPQSGMPLQLGAGTPAANTMSADFECRIPRAAVAGGTAHPARPSLYGHGLFGGYGEVEAGNVGAMADEHDFVFCAADWAGMATIDVPNVATILTDLSNFPTLADRVQQGMLDFLYLGRLMIHPQGLAADPAFRLGGHPLIDTSHLYYDGNSQGGIIGGALTAVAPDYTRAVLGVPGMNYSTLLTRSTDFGDGHTPSPHPDPNDLGNIDNTDVSYAWPLYTSYPNQLERPLLFGLIQQLWDRAEPDGYAWHMTSDPLPGTPAHEVLLHAAFGDHQVANVTTEVEARTIGAHILRKPMLDPGRHADVDPYDGIPAFPTLPGTGSALVVWDSGSPTPPITNTSPQTGEDPHSHPRSDPKARAQKSAFLAPDGGVIDVCSGGPCYAHGYTGPH